VGTAAAAGTYPTDTEACANLGHFLDCTIAEDQAACEANTNCQFVKDEEIGFEGCTPSDAINVVTENALNNATAALESQIEICGAFTVEEDCVGACAWAVDPDEWNGPPSCFASASKAQSILIADGADPYTRGYLYDRAAAAVCGLADDQTSCEAKAGRVYEDEP
jgi:hypothetical protein